MNITVQLVKDILAGSGGGFADLTLDISIDDMLDAHDRAETVLHEIVENFFPFIPHDKVDEVVALMISGLEQAGVITEAVTHEV